MGRLIPAVAVLAVLAAGCGKTINNATVLNASGTIVRQKLALADFTVLDVSQVFEVTITQGEGFAVVIRVDQVVAPYLQIARTGQTLRIGLKDGSYSFQNAPVLEAAVTLPALSAITLSGSSRATLVGFESAERFQATVSGASTLQGAITAGDVAFDISGSSVVALVGSGAAAVITTSGSSEARLGDFMLVDARIDASGSSTVRVAPSGTLTAQASGSASVRYAGSPRLGTIETSGSATVRVQE